MLRVTVCELNSEPELFEADWARLAAHVRAESSDLVLLPEMPFAPWFAWTRDADPAVWRAAVDAHERWLQWLPELGAACVLGSRPVERDGVRLNEGFAWDVEHGYRAAHTKYHLPDESGYWEASWYARGDGRFEPLTTGPARVGFLICTELWFFGHARAYGQQGVHVLANPRATEKATVDKWLVAGRAAAVVAGAYALSSNHINPPGRPADLGGQGWCVGPDGDVLGVTTRAQPFLTIPVDLALAEAAKRSYPRYVAD